MSATYLFGSTDMERYGSERLYNRSSALSDQDDISLDQGLSRRSSISSARTQMRRQHSETSVGKTADKSPNSILQERVASFKRLLSKESTTTTSSEQGAPLLSSSRTHSVADTRDEEVDSFNTAKSTSSSPMFSARSTSSKGRSRSLWSIHSPPSSHSEEMKMNGAALSTSSIASIGRSDESGVDETSSPQSVRDRARSFTDMIQHQKEPEPQLKKLERKHTFEFQSQGFTFERFIATFFLINTEKKLGNDVYVHGSFNVNPETGEWGPPERMIPASQFPEGWFCAKARCEQDFEFFIANAPDLKERPDAIVIRDPATGSNFKVTDRTRVVTIPSITETSKGNFGGTVHNTNSFRAVQEIAWDQVKERNKDMERKLAMEKEEEEQKKREEEERIEKERAEREAEEERERERVKREEEERLRLEQEEKERREEEQRQKEEEERKQREEQERREREEMEERRKKEEEEERKRREQEEEEAIRRVLVCDTAAIMGELTDKPSEMEEPEPAAQTNPPEPPQTTPDNRPWVFLDAGRVYAMPVEKLAQCPPIPPEIFSSPIGGSGSSVRVTYTPEGIVVEHLGPVDVTTYCKMKNMVITPGVRTPAPPVPSVVRPGSPQVIRGTDSTPPAAAAGEGTIVPRRRPSFFEKFKGSFKAGSVNGLEGVKKPVVVVIAQDGTRTETSLEEEGGKKKKKGGLRKFFLKLWKIMTFTDTEKAKKSKGEKAPTLRDFQVQQSQSPSQSQKSATASKPAPQPRTVVYVKHKKAAMVKLPNTVPVMYAYRGGARPMTPPPYTASAARGSFNNVHKGHVIRPMRSTNRPPVRPIVLLPVDQLSNQRTAMVA
eukprot:comp23298_c0_seq1/m.38242 comp23298_c0_seq1/g.38242  ORF comp23298_c0_seq1/g.38242 comp23298_c0_seq1/m.38242 type:complete len:836 (-) comp23298_c0_seq1:388-2895(-)